MTKVECVAPTGCLLGTAPLWSPSEGFLWWVDSKRAKLHRHNPCTGNTRRYDLPLHASAIALAKGQLLMAGDQEMGLYDPGTEAYYQTKDMSADLATSRVDDGGIAPDGSFWFGTIDDQNTNARDAYFRVDQSGQLNQLGITSTHGASTIAFSPDKQSFYTCDRMEQEIIAFDYDPVTNALTQKRLFATTSQTGCYPRGSAVDVDGYLWNAQWAASRLARYAPDGSLDRTVELPVSRPTHCAFGGDELKTLYITSARFGLSDKAMDRQPMAGCLFAVDVGIAGLPITEWEGSF